MKTATSLTVIAVGAILAFAVTASPGFLNIQIVGWILMITGAIGLTLSRNNREWLRRTVIVRGAPRCLPGPPAAHHRRSGSWCRPVSSSAASPAPAGSDVAGAEDRP